MPGASVSDAFQLFVFLESPNGDISLAKTGITIGMNSEGRLVSYLSFQVEPGLASVQLNSPSRIVDADPKVMLYIFLALFAFMAVNQGEAPLSWIDSSTARLG